MIELVLFGTGERNIYKNMGFYGLYSTFQDERNRENTICLKSIWCRCCNWGFTAEIKMFGEFLEESVSLSNSGGGDIFFRRVDQKNKNIKSYKKYIIFLGFYGRNKKYQKSQEETPILVQP